MKEKQGIVVSGCIISKEYVQRLQDHMNRLNTFFLLIKLLSDKCKQK